jgi:uncharacterized protein DUF2442
MLKDVVEVRPLGGYRVWLRFEDGVEGDLDLGQVIEFKGIFAPLRDEREFAKVRVHSELGAIAWPNGADLDPDVLYAKLTGRAIETGVPSAQKA